MEEYTIKVDDHDEIFRDTKQMLTVLKAVSVFCLVLTLEDALWLKTVDVALNLDRSLSVTKYTVNDLYGRVHS